MPFCQKNRLLNLSEYQIITKALFFQFNKIIIKYSLMNHPKTSFRHKVVWYFYSDDEIAQVYQQKIREAYACLQIDAYSTVINHPKTLMNLFESQIWELADINKVVVFDVQAKRQKIKQKLKEKDREEQSQNDLKKLQELQMLLGNENPRMQLYFYNSMQVFFGYINQALKQAQFVKKDKRFLSELMLINQGKWKMNFAFIIKLYSVLSDENTFKPNKKNWLMENGYLKEYINNKEFRKSVKQFQKNFHLKDNCQKIGFQVKKMHQQIRRVYLLNKQYLNGSYVQGWKLFITDEQQLSLKKHDNLYMHKTFGVYHSSLEQIIKKETISPQTKLIAFKMILRNRAKRQQSYERDYSMFNHGFAIVDNKIIVNCMNTFKLLRIKPIVYTKTVQIDGQKSFINYKITVLQFELIPFADLVSISMYPGENTQSSKIMSLFRFARNYLRKNNFKISLESAYIENGQYEFAAKYLAKKKKKKIEFDQNLYDIVGRQQYRIKTQFNENETIQNVQKMAQLCKDLMNQDSYFQCLQEFLKRYKNSENVFQKYIKRGKYLIEISLIKGLKQNSQVQNFIAQVNQIKNIIEQLGAKLSHQYFINKAIEQSNKKCFLNRLCCCNDKVLLQSQKKEYDKQLLQQFFPNFNQLKGQKFLNQFKLQFIQFYNDAREAIVKIYRYGDRNQQFAKIKVQILQQQQKYINLIKQRSKLQKHQTSQWNIKVYQKQFQEQQQKIRKACSAIAEIKNYPIKQGSVPQKKSEEKSVILQNQFEQLVNWEETNSIIQKANSQMRESQEWLQKKNQEDIEQTLQSQEKSIIYEKRSKIIKDTIKFLKENYYSNNSIKLLILYQAQLQKAFKLQKVQQIEQLSRLQFADQRKNSNFFKAEAYHKLATIHYESLSFSKSIICASQSIKYYKKGKVNVPKVYLDLDLLKIQAKIRQITQHHNPQQSHINRLEGEIIELGKKWERQCQSNKTKIYKIQLDLLLIKLLQLKGDQHIYKNIMERYKDVEKRKQQFYDQRQISSIMMFFDIIRINNQANQINDYEKYYNKIFRGFDRPLQSEEGKLGNYIWVKNMALFFKEKAKDLTYIEVLPARKYIEDALFYFQDIKSKNGCLAFELKGHYNIIYKIYQKFMDEKFRYFYRKPNILQDQDFQKKQSVKSQVENDNKEGEQEKKVENRLFDQITWIIILSQKELAKEKEQLQSIYKTKKNDHVFHEISISSQTLIKKKIDEFKNLNLKIKMVINLQNFNKFFLQGGSMNKQRKKIDAFEIIAQNSNKMANQIQVLMEKKSNNEINIIERLTDKIEIIYNQQRQNNETKLSNNVFFYRQNFSDVIHQYHIVVYSSLSEKTNYLQAQQASRKLLENSTIKCRPIFQQYLTLGQRFRQLRRNFVRSEGKKTQDDLKQISLKIIMMYKRENQLYNFMNNTIRNLCKEIDFNNFNPNSLQSLIFPQYYAIRALFNHQKQQKVFQIGQKIILWRKASMRENQFKIFYNQQRHKPFIQFVSFLSTSYSLQVVLDMLKKDPNFHDQVIFHLQVEITEKLLSSPLNNGFYKFENDISKQQELLFNIFNIFQVHEASCKKIEQIAKQHYEKDLNSSQEGIKDFLKKKVRFISLKMSDFSNIVREKLTDENSHYKLFQNVQSAFLKKRNKFQVTQNGITISRFGLIECYQALGKLDKEIGQIKKQMDQQDSENHSDNLTMKVIKNCMKKGQLPEAKKILQEIQLKVSYRKNIQKEISEAKFIIFQFLMVEQLDVQTNEKEIEQIKDKIEKSVCANHPEEIQKKVKENILGLCKSNNQFGLQNIENYLERLDTFLDQIKKILPQLKAIKIQGLSQQKNRNQYKKAKQYSQYFLKAMKQTIVKCNKTLNKKFHKKISELYEKTMHISAAFSSLQNQNEFQSNASCCAYASSTILTHSNADFLQQKSDCDEIETLAQVKFKLEDYQSRRLEEPQDTKNIIKEITFHLSGKLESKIMDIINLSLQGGQEIRSKYCQLIQKIVGDQIKELKEQGYHKQSPQLFRAHRKFIQNKIRQIKDYEVILNEFMAKQQLSCSSKIEVCRFYLLKAQIQFLMVENQLIETQYRDIKNKQLYQQAEGNLKEARNNLVAAYKIQESLEDNSLWKRFLCKCKFFKPKNEKKMEISDENLLIHALELKINHGKFRITQPQSKEELLLSLQNLGNLVNIRRYDYQILNQEILVYQMYSIYALTFTKQLGYHQSDFQKYFKKFSTLLQQRKDQKGEKNIENSESCLQLFQLLNSSLKKRISKADYQNIERYIDFGAWNCQNNNLFWRFAVCNFNKIPHRQANIKLKYLESALMVLWKYENSAKQKMVEKIEKTFNLYYKKYIKNKQIKGVDQNQINILVTNIQNALQAIKHKQQIKPSQVVVQKKQQSVIIDQYFKKEKQQVFNPKEVSNNFQEFFQDVLPPEQIKNEISPVIPLIKVRPPILDQEQNLAVSQFFSDFPQQNAFQSNYGYNQPLFNQLTQRNLLPIQVKEEPKIQQSQSKKVRKERNIGRRKREFLQPLERKLVLESSDVNLLSQGEKIIQNSSGQPWEQ